MKLLSYVQKLLLDLGIKSKSVAMVETNNKASRTLITSWEALRGTTGLLEITFNAADANN